MKKLSLLLPMNGTGQRFRSYSSVPKPLIKINNREMIFWLLDLLNLESVKKIVIPYNSQLDHYDFKNIIRLRYPHLDFTLLSLSKPTTGNAETISVALGKLSSSELESNFVVMDCDTFYYDDVIELYNQSPIKNAIFYSLDYNPAPIFSYIKVKNDLVTEIKEKQKISDFANCGIFCAKDGHTLQKYCSMLLSKGQKQKNEFYTSGVFDLMLKDNISIAALEVQNFKCVGTPLQLERFLREKE